jgi:hypothetical protein
VDKPVVIGDAPAFRRLIFVASASPSAFGVADFIGAGRRHKPKVAVVSLPSTSKSAIQVTSQLLLLVGIKSIHVVCFA